MYSNNGNENLNYKNSQMDTNNNNNFINNNKNQNIFQDNKNYNQEKNNQNSYNSNNFNNNNNFIPQINQENNNKISSNPYDKKDQNSIPSGNQYFNQKPPNPYENKNDINQTPTGNIKIQKNKLNDLTPTGKTKIENDLTPTGNDQNNINREQMNYITPGGNDYYENNYIYDKMEDSNNNQNIPFSFNQFKKPSLVGLDDVKNSMTYMSSILRCLSNIKPIIKYYLKQLNNYRSHANDMPLSYHFSRLIFNLYPYPQNSFNTSFSLQTFYKAAIHSNPIFKGKSLKNPIEFIIYLLDSLHDDDKKMPNNNNKSNLDNNIQKNQNNFDDFEEYLKHFEKSIIFNNFRWINIKTATCNECKEKLSIYRELFTFDLNIENTINKLEFKNTDVPIIRIYDCIKNQSNEEILYNTYCNICKKKNIIKVQSLIKTSPNYFVFLIKLNNKEIIENLKNEGLKIKIEKDIDLDEFIKDSNFDSKFELIGMIVYNNINNVEEYISYCIHPIDNKWYKFDINNINQIDIDKLLEANDLLPVILFYKSKNSLKQ